MGRFGTNIWPFTWMPRDKQSGDQQPHAFHRRQEATRYEPKPCRSRSTGGSREPSRPWEAGKAAPRMARRARGRAEGVRHVRSPLFDWAETKDRPSIPPLWKPDYPQLCTLNPGFVGSPYRGRSGEGRCIVAGMGSRLWFPAITAHGCRSCSCERPAGTPANLATPRCGFRCLASGLHSRRPGQGRRWLERRRL
jgi:hypothetical protein